MKSPETLRVLLIASVLGFMSQDLRAQVIRYSTDFPDTAGWSLDPGPCSTCVRWNVDATPVSVLGTPSWRSAPFSLNYNDGNCFGAFNCVGISSGRATSPAIDISAPAAGVSLSFWCMWDTELDGACYFDTRSLQASKDGFQSLELDLCYDDLVCGSPGLWHQHVVGLQPAWGMIQARYTFDSQGGMLNDGAGWFIEDFEVATVCVPPASYCTAKVNSRGCTPRIHSTGYPSATQPVALRIRAGMVISHRAGLLFYGYGSASIPFQGGTLCVRAPIQRIAAQHSGGNPPPPDCSGTYSYDFNERIRSGLDLGLVAGEDVYAQYWSRDPQSPSHTGLTDALAFVICP